MIKSYEEIITVNETHDPITIHHRLGAYPAHVSFWQMLDDGREYSQIGSILVLSRDAIRVQMGHAMTNRYRVVVTVEVDS